MGSVMGGTVPGVVRGWYMHFAGCSAVVLPCRWVVSRARPTMQVGSGSVKEGGQEEVLTQGGTGWHGGGTGWHRVAQGAQRTTHPPLTKTQTGLLVVSEQGPSCAQNVNRKPLSY